MGQPPESTADLPTAGVTPPARRPWRWRRRVAVGVLLLLAFILGWYAIGRLLSPWSLIRSYEMVVETPPAAAPEPLRIVAYNIAHGRGMGDSNWSNKAGRDQRLEDIAALLGQLDAHVVVLNEVDFDAVWSGHENQARRLAREAGYPFVAEQRNLDVNFPLARVRYGNAILSRFPLSDVEVVNLPGPSRWETVLAGKKQAVAATVHLPSGRRVRVIGVHLDHREETTRVAGARAIVRAVKAADLPVIVAGDLNSAPVGFPEVQTDPDGGTAVAHLLEAGLLQTLPDVMAAAADFTFPADNPNQVIDWVMVSPPLVLRERTVIESTLSDHRPVLATVQVGESN